MGGVLALASTGLKPFQDKSEALDKRKQILSAVRELKGDEDVLQLYGTTIESFVVNIKGEVVEKDAEGNDFVAEDIEIGKEYKKKPEETRISCI